MADALMQLGFIVLILVAVLMILVFMAEIDRRWRTPSKDDDWFSWLRFWHKDR
jgi:hypothetical protein